MYVTPEADAKRGRESTLTRFMLFPLMAALLVFGAMPAEADVALRVAEPVSSPVKVRVTVTEDGAPMTGLAVGDFTVQVDGNRVPLSSDDFSQPAAEDPNQRVSVVFVMDYSGSVTDVALNPLQTAIENFINTMQLGDYAAIIKFSGIDNLSVEQPFTEITGDNARSALISTIYATFPDNGTALYAALNLGLAQFDSPSVPLPTGPKAIIVASDGVENAFGDIGGRDVVDYAKELGVSIFSIGLGPLDDIVQGDVKGRDVLEQFAQQTGGQYTAASDTEITEVYQAVSNLLNNEYLLTFAYGIAACDDYTILVSVEGYDSAETTVSSCPFTSSGGESSGGGGAFGPLGLIAGLSLLALRRRLRGA